MTKATSIHVQAVIYSPLARATPSYTTSSSSSSSSSPSAQKGCGSPNVRARARLFAHVIHTAGKGGRARATLSPPLSSLDLENSALALHRASITLAYLHMREFSARSRARTHIQPYITGPRESGREPPLASCAVGKRSSARRYGKREGTCIVCLSATLSLSLSLFRNSRKVKDFYGTARYVALSGGSRCGAAVREKRAELRARRRDRERNSDDGESGARRL